MALRIERIFTVIAACLITTINGECIDAPSYSGTLNVTLDGYTCQRWDSQQPHQHTTNTSNHFPNDVSVNEAHNYCRDANGLYEDIWCYTTDSEIEWDYCVSHSDICLMPIIYEGKCQTLPENKNSTHCPNDTSFYWCKPYLALTSILYDLECETYECCPAYLPTTHQSLSSTDSPEHNEKPEACCPPAGLESLVKAQTSLSGQVEGSTIAPNTSAEIATPSSSCNRWTCNLYFVHFVLFMAVFFATTCTKDY